MLLTRGRGQLDVLCRVRVTWMSSRPSLILRKIIEVVLLLRTMALFCVHVFLPLAVSSRVLSIPNTFVSGVLAAMFPVSVPN